MGCQKTIAGQILDQCADYLLVLKANLHIFIDFGQLCSLKPATDVHGNRPAVFMISATRFQAGQHTWKAS
jgi:hypothetical protein